MSMGRIEASFWHRRKRPPTDFYESGELIATDVPEDDKVDVGEELDGASYREGEANSARRSAGELRRGVWRMGCNNRRRSYSERRREACLPMLLAPTPTFCG
jgi:hypothetical protein